LSLGGQNSVMAPHALGIAFALARFKRALAAGLSDQRLHDLCPCAGTFVVTKGASMRVVMDILGNSKMATTADLYAHVLLAAHRDVANLNDQIKSRYVSARTT
jgi:hypothetical protein